MVPSPSSQISLDSPPAHPGSLPHRCHTLSLPHLLLLLTTVLPIIRTSTAAALSPSNHTSNAAVIVSTSRYWHNYRHASNTLAIYKVLKSLGGFSDDNIILMLADDIPCNARNPFKSTVFHTYANGGKGDNLFSVHDEENGGGVEVDYRGTDVTADAFRRVLLGRHLPGESSSRTLHHTFSADTNLLIFMTGHGGDQFFKFQDGEELTTHDLQSLFSHMKQLKRFKEALLILDTCQAFSMADGIEVEGVRVIGSSLKGENSYAHHGDEELGLSVVDRFTQSFVEFLERRKSQWDRMMMNGNGGNNNRNKKQTLLLDTISIKEGLVDSMSFRKLGSNVGLKDDNCIRKSKDVPLSDFFAMKGTYRGKGGDGLDLLTDKCEFFLDADESLKEESFSSQTCVQEMKEEWKLTSTMVKTKGDSSGDEGTDDGSGRGGMRPSDPMFLIYILGLGVLVLSSSRLT